MENGGLEDDWLVSFWGPFSTEPWLWEERVFFWPKKQQHGNSAIVIFLGCWNISDPNSKVVVRWPPNRGSSLVTNWITWRLHFQEFRKMIWRWLFSLLLMTLVNCVNLQFVSGRVLLYYVIIVYLRIIRKMIETYSPIFTSQTFLHFRRANLGRKFIRIILLKLNHADPTMFTKWLTKDSYTVASLPLTGGYLSKVIFWKGLTFSGHFLVHPR